MFCPKCGNQTADTVAFCPKCGERFKRATNNIQSNNIFQKYIIGWKEFFSPKWVLARKICWAGAHALVLILAVIIVSSVSEKNIELMDSTRTVVSVTDKDIASLVIDAPITLEGKYPKLETIVSEGAAVTLSGEFPVLKSVNMKPDADGTIGDFVFVKGTSFPALTSFNGSTILTQNYNIAAFDSAAFLAIQEINLCVDNKEFDEAFYSTLECVDEMQRNNMVKTATVEVLHEISDLYGTWSTDNGVLSFTFQSDGKVRVADEGNVLGANLFTYSELDEDTLGLKADTENVILNILEIAMDYEILGDRLKVGFAGNDFELKRID